MVPNDAQQINAYQRIYIAAQAAWGLQRANGFFDVPPDDVVAITAPNGMTLDTRLIAVWAGRYAAYFEQFRGDHERAIRLVEQDIGNSDEARQKRGAQDQGPAPDPVPGDPTWRPTREQIRRYRGTFALGTGRFSYFAAAMSSADFDRELRARLDRGDTHMLLGLQSNGYRGQAGFNLWGNPATAIRRAEQMYAAGIIPCFVLHDDTSVEKPEGQRAAVYERHWRGVADALRPYVSLVIPAFEWNDHLTPREQHHLLHVLAELFPDAYRAVTFTDNRGALTLDLNHRDDKGTYEDDPVWGLPRVNGRLVEEYQWWQTLWNGGNPIVHALAFQAPLECLDDHAKFGHRITDWLLRLGACKVDDLGAEWQAEKDDYWRKFQGQTAGHFDVWLWECGAERILNGSLPDLGKLDALGAYALRFPGLLGAGDGWKA